MALSTAAPPRRSRRTPRAAQTGDYAFADTVVTSVEPVTAHLRRITVHAPELATFPFGGPDQWVKLFFPAPGQDRAVLPLSPHEPVDGWYQRFLAMPTDVRPVMRTYTVRAFDRDRATVTIDMVTHGEDSPGSAWALRARPGDALPLFGPGQAYCCPADADWQLLVGDETALPAIGAIVEQRDGLRTVAVIEVDGAADCVGPRPVPGLDVVWVLRHGRPSASSTALLDAVGELTFPPGRPYAWLAGEASKVKALRRQLVDRDVDRGDICFIGYWRAGRSEDERAADGD